MPFLVNDLRVNWFVRSGLLGFKALEALHCRAAGIIFELPWEMSNANVMKKANWSSLAFMYKISLAKLMYKIQTLCQLLLRTMITSSDINLGRN